ncbi:MAG: hypothetical protein KME54_17685 [Tolypothrix brevis GSE-NOS-MK-07-07A]|jgi:hypothetical protein|nr:hypothetical protein [Tolypothrix brevis GSE-NOS-MK-07-07A]
MTPIELQIKWNLSNTELAIAIRKTEETIKAYKVRKSARSHRNPPQSTILLCELLDKEWEAAGTAQIRLVAA